MCKKRDLRFYAFCGVRTNGKQGKCSHTCVFGKQFECEHTRYFCAVVRQKCLPKCLLGSLPKPSSSQSPLCSVSALRRKRNTLPCSSSPHATRFAGLAQGPHRLRPGANAPGLNFGTKCPKAETPRNSTKLFTGRLENVESI